eukprot:2078380-Rhodomonas_salina.1
MQPALCNAGILVVATNCVEIIVCAFDFALGWEQVVAWVEALYDKGHAENKDIRQTRAEIVSYCFHKLVETSRTRELLTLLDPEARKVRATMCSNTTSRQGPG